MKNSFTLVEVLVAVAILAGVIGAAAAIEARNISSSSQNKRQIEALGLAQQGLNLSKSISDSNKLDPTKPELPAPGAYSLDTSTPALAPVSGTAVTVPAEGKICDGTQGQGVWVQAGTGSDARWYCREIIISPNP